MSTQQQFLNDLQQFISQHPHFINNKGSIENLNEDTDTIISISDPDGDFEQIQITINLIS